MMAVLWVVLMADLWAEMSVHAKDMMLAAQTAGTAELLVVL